MFVVFAGGGSAGPADSGLCSATVKERGKPESERDGDASPAEPVRRGSREQDPKQPSVSSKRKGTSGWGEKIERLDEKMSERKHLVHM
jgi:hypothetical protein